MAFDQLLGLVQELREALSTGHENTSYLETELEKLGYRRAATERELRQAMAVAHERSAYLGGELERLSQRRQATERELRQAMAVARERTAYLEAELDRLASLEAVTETELQDALALAHERSKYLEGELEKLVSVESRSDGAPDGTEAPMSGPPASNGPVRPSGSEPPFPPRPGEPSTPDAHGPRDFGDSARPAPAGARPPAATRPEPAEPAPVAGASGAASAPEPVATPGLASAPEPASAGIHAASAPDATPPSSAASPPDVGIAPSSDSTPKPTFALAAASAPERLEPAGDTVAHHAQEQTGDEALDAVAGAETPDSPGEGDAPDSGPGMTADSFAEGPMPCAVVAEAPSREHVLAASPPDAAAAAEPPMLAAAETAPILRPAADPVLAVPVSVQAIEAKPAAMSPSAESAVIADALSARMPPPPAAIREPLSSLSAAAGASAPRPPIAGFTALADSDSSVAPPLREAINRNDQLVIPLVIGKFADRDIEGELGDPIVTRGQEITKGIAELARQAGKLYDLWRAAQPARPGGTV